MAHRRSRGFVRPPPRTNLWLGTTLAATGVAASSSALVLTLNAAALLLRPFTIIRTRFLFQVQTDQVVSSEFPKGAVGKIVVQEDATTAGIASVPNPIDDTNAPWFVWQPFEEGFNLLTSAGAMSNFGRQYMIDSKAMRKVGQSEQVATVVQVESAFGATVSIGGRILIKLH